MEVEEVNKLLLAAEKEKQELKEKYQELKEKYQEMEGKNQEREEKYQEMEGKNQEREEKYQEMEEDLQESTLTEYLTLCHEHLSGSISVQTDLSQSTKGDPSNAVGKLRPDYLRPWEDFIDTQKKQLETLYSIYPASNDMPRVFDNRSSIKTRGKNVALRKLASEQDLQNLQYDIVELPVTKIVQHLKSLDDVRDEFKLGGGIQFYNHMNTLSDGNDEVAQRLKEQQVGPPTPRLQPDSICVFTTIEDNDEPAMAAELKPPHKLTLAHLRLVLGSNHPSLDLDSIINRVREPSPKDEITRFKFNAERLVAAVVTQAFHYMVECGIKYGYITTGEAYVFLCIKPEENAKTVYYHLAEPKEDVNAQKRAYPNKKDYLHRTAISQLLAFSLLALSSVQETPDWRDTVIRTLKTWRVDYESILKDIRETPEPQDRSSPFLLSPSSSRTYSLDIPDRSPIHNRLRSRKVTCRPWSDATSKSNQNPSPTNDPSDTPNRSQSGQRGKQGQRGQRALHLTGAGSSSHGGQRRAFCTQLCLQGLAQGGPLDHHCPNVSKHCGEGHQGDRHQIKGEEFLMLLGEQLRRSRGDACQPLGLQGSRGALFKVTLTSHGYTVVGKGTVLAFVKDLRHEAEVYRCLTTVQGVHIPIFLGSIELDHPYYYQAGIRIVHLMLLSWAGECLYGSKICAATDWPRWTSDLIRAVHAIHEAGVLHQDIRMPNLVWNEENGRIMVIDFERAEIVKTNRKRKLPCGTESVDGEDKIVDMIKKDLVIRSRMAALDISAARMVFNPTVPDYLRC